MSQTPIGTNPSKPSAVDLSNVQGDVIYGLAKDFEHFVFFTITERDGFQKRLPLLQITTSEKAKGTWDAIAQLKAVSPGQRHDLKLLNISFSQKGLDALGITENLNDKFFSGGQRNDAAALGDTIDKDNQPKWKPEYSERMDGVLIGAGNTFELANSAVNEALATLQGTVKEVYRLQGNTRPDDQRKNEHFGWRDGISNPAIKDLPYPDTHVIEEDRVRPGVLLVGHDGDNDHQGLKPVPRPPWAFEGSFMVFRELKQLVPEFHQFLEENPYFPDGMIIDRKLAVQLQGARFIGRWTNGVPIQLSPTSPNGDLKNLNDFVYPQETGDAGQTACPYSAHLRKTRPRNDLDNIKPVLKESSRINRKGIAYGEGTHTCTKEVYCVLTEFYYRSKAGRGKES
ncbi:Dye-decolorizing peroxidase msp1 [Ceratobasidium sp. AG-Ba]|nr:Dye-decolorizing peroxidase msp1 [Ceratobasidium sp. AG-Ba]QRW06213.1 Dye-decolorizing peroxidase msp1 [Ceratobasidium sp. AG-Ba]